MHQRDNFRRTSAPLVLTSGQPAEGPSEQRTGDRSAAPGLHLRVGVDLVSVDRVGRLVTKHPRATDRLFTEAELAYCRGRRRFHEHLAARFAAKEAVGKALGTGVGVNIPWKAVEVLAENSGRPYVRLHGEALRCGRRHGLVELDLSLSHTESLAAAYVVALVASPPRGPDGWSVS